MNRLTELRVEYTKLCGALMTEFDTTLNSPSDTDTFTHSLVDGFDISQQMNQLEAEHRKLCGRNWWCELDPNWDDVAQVLGLSTQAQFKAEQGLSEEQWHQITAEMRRDMEGFKS